jgi:hypothetical protein
MNPQQADSITSLERDSSLITTLASLSPPVEQAGLTVNLYLLVFVAMIIFLVYSQIMKPLLLNATQKILLISLICYSFVKLQGLLILVEIKAAGCFLNFIL